MYVRVITCGVHVRMHELHVRVFVHVCYVCTRARSRVRAPLLGPYLFGCADALWSVCA